MFTRVLTHGRLACLVALAIAGCGGDDAPQSPADAGLSIADAGDPPVLDASFEPDLAEPALPMMPSPVGSCCATHDTPGCEEALVQECVCAIDRLCCAGAWDERCVQLVDREGCGQCGAPPSTLCEITDSTDAAPSTLGGILGDAEGATNDALELSCGSIAEPDVVFGFTAPAAGSYDFSTRGSEVFDTVLAVIDGAACEGEELGCNDDDSGELTSKVTVELAAGQEVLIAVESWGEESGAIAVEIATAAAPEIIDVASCEPSELPSTLPASATGEASEVAGQLTPSCALYGSAGEAFYRFTAELAGRYRFDTRGSDADTVVQVLDGDCAGAELACNDDSDLGGLAAIAELDLSEGQTVVVNVDSLDGLGRYALTVDLASDSDETPPVESSGNCCEPQSTASCADTGIAACVCAVDDFCCTNLWDELCVEAVAALECGVDCP